MKLSFSELCGNIGKIKKAIISTHISPDPDALCSSGATALLLKELGAEVVIYIPEAFPDYYAPLLDGLPLVKRVEPSAYSHIVVLDCANKQRALLKDSDWTDFSGEVLNIDHHLSNSFWGSLNYVDSQASATAEIVQLLWRGLNTAINPIVANLLYAGLLDDTGCFCFSNTSARCLEQAAELVSCGAKPEYVANQLYYSLPQRILKLRAAALGTLKLVLNNQIAIFLVSQEMIKDCAAHLEDTEGLANLARSIGGTRGSVFMRELGDGDWKLSLRSKDGLLDVNQVAAVFGGGGHRAAAGCKIAGSAAVVEDVICRELEKALLAV